MKMVGDEGLSLNPATALSPIWVSFRRFLPFGIGKRLHHLSDKCNSKTKKSKKSFWRVAIAQGCVRVLHNARHRNNFYFPTSHLGDEGKNRGKRKVSQFYHDLTQVGFAGKRRRNPAKTINFLPLKVLCCINSELI